MDFGVFPPALLKIQAELEITKMEIALLSSTTFVVCGVFTIFTAPIMARFNARSVLVVMALV